ncbi:MAG: imidazole glycerol phosphate synthase subunit HisH [Dissulfurimicrobium sp.]|uniref:imidazole glycerol phosphate synthase subunit HisH n=1 Tax=Dissulfurimicrobium sp. TaxID=2022436 RepID=UPI00404A22EA
MFNLSVMIVIIDYKAGNLASVARAVTYLGFACEITSEPKKIMAADHIIFPGVGAAGQAMAELKALGLDEVLKEAFAASKPILGICLGTQIIFEYSEEGGTSCLGILPGSVRRFPSTLFDDGSRLKIPHMGWNKVRWVAEHPVFVGHREDSQYYFVHSYYPAPADKNLIIGMTRYGMEFSSVVSKESLVAVQFHPEKSGRPGLQILANFCNWRP